MSDSEILPVQLPGRRHVIGAPTSETAVQYFTADATLDEMVMNQVRAKNASLSILSGQGAEAPAPPCTAVRDLFEGTAGAGSVILTCEKEHHMDVHAHQMTNPDGSTTTWRR